MTKLDDKIETHDFPEFGIEIRGPAAAVSAFIASYTTLMLRASEWDRLTEEAKRQPRLLWKEKRKAARVSLHQASAKAGVTPTTARAFELGGPEIIKEPATRDALISVWNSF